MGLQPNERKGTKLSAIAAIEGDCLLRYERNRDNKKVGSLDNAGGREENQGGEKRRLTCYDVTRFCRRDFASVNCIEISSAKGASK